jgi:molybdopterin-guanine dinucleotide biosynthesis protein A
MISVNQQQFADYSSIFSSSQLIVDNASLQLRGPLLGILSGHLQNPSEDIFALACDMPLMESSILKELHIQYKQSNQNDAFVFTTDGEPEPLCGIYTAKGLASILALYHSKQLLKHSMKFMLEQIAVCEIPVADDQKKYFRNINAHAELNGL